MIRFFIYIIPELAVSIRNYFQGKSKPKRFPTDYTRKELVDLLNFHHSNSTEAQTQLHNTREKLIETQKELSRLKRGQK